MILATTRKLGTAIIKQTVRWAFQTRRLMLWGLETQKKTTTHTHPGLGCVPNKKN